MRALSLREPFDPMLVALPMLSRFFDAVASFGGAFSASFGMDGGGAADARRGGAGEGDSPNVIRDKECREVVSLSWGVSSEPAAGCFFAEPSIIVAIVARSDASSVEALSRPSEDLRLISALRRSTPARIFEKLIFPAASVISRILDLGVPSAAACATATGPAKASSAAAALSLIHI